MRYFLIIGSMLIFLILHLAAIFSEVNMYPFVKYDMFARPYLNNHYRSLVIATVIDSKEEFLSSTKFSSSFFFPFNQRGFYHSLFESLKTANQEGKNKIFSELFRSLKQRKPQITSLKLYRFECNCENFRLNNDKLINYINDQGCEKKLLYEFKK